MLPVAAFWTSLGLNYNTAVVLLGTILIGFTSGMLGVFLLLRRRALIGDAIAHATLPGVAIAFLWLALND
ncbi:MAG: metal ABC transporter permease, partial [Planctomycetota bacterium]